MGERYNKPEIKHLILSPVLGFKLVGQCRESSHSPPIHYLMCWSLLQSSSNSLKLHILKLNPGHDEHNLKILCLCWHFFFWSIFEKNPRNWKPSSARKPKTVKFNIFCQKLIKVLQ